VSGPVLLEYSGGALGGYDVNNVMLNGIGGAAALYDETGSDELVFDLYIDGKLRFVDKVCHEGDGPALVKSRRAEYLVTRKTRVRPP